MPGRLGHGMARGERGVSFLGNFCSLPEMEDAHEYFPTHAPVPVSRPQTGTAVLFYTLPQLNLSSPPPPATLPLLNST